MLNKVINYISIINQLSKHYLEMYGGIDDILMDTEVTDLQNFCLRTST